MLRRGKGSICIIFIMFNCIKMEERDRREMEIGFGGSKLNRSNVRTKANLLLWNCRKQLILGVFALAYEDNGFGLYLLVIHMKYSTISLINNDY